MGMELKCRRKIEENLFHINFCDAADLQKNNDTNFNLKNCTFFKLN